MAFVEGAAQESAAKEGTAPAAPAVKAKKVQVPLLVPPALLAELDGSIADYGTGMSRSAWICQAIREKLDSQK